MECSYKSYDFQVNEIGGTMLEDEYNKMIDILEAFKPHRICELGSGQSTQIFEKYSSKYIYLLYFDYI